MEQFYISGLAPTKHFIIISKTTQWGTKCTWGIGTYVYRCWHPPNIPHCNMHAGNQCLSYCMAGHLISCPPPPLPILVLHPGITRGRLCKEFLLSPWWYVVFSSPSVQKCQWHCHCLVPWRWPYPVCPSLLRAWSWCLWLKEVCSLHGRKVTIMKKNQCCYCWAFCTMVHAFWLEICCNDQCFLER